MNRRSSIRFSAVWNGVLLGALFFLATGAPCQSMPAEGPPLLNVSRFVVQGENPLSAEETEAVLAPHVGPHRSLDTLEAAAGALEQALRKKGFSFHRVIVPAQRPVGGQITLQVLRFPLNDVTVTGNQNFASSNILRSLPALVPGSSPDVNELARELSFANEHPSKRMSVHIKESMKRDHLDAEVRVRDVPQVQTFIGMTGHSRDFDNTLNRNTGYTRLTIGHQRGNLFDLDHVLTLAYTTSPEYISRVSQFGAFYWMPLYGYHTTLNAYYTRSDVDNGSVGIGGQSFDVSGRGEFWGLRATYSLPKVGFINHNVSAALDDRFFESNVGFLGTQLPTSSVGGRPLSLRYLARTEQIEGAIGGYAEYVVNTSGGRANDDASYAAARSGARQDWEAIRWGVDATYTLRPGWALNGRFRAQYAYEPLIPGEQFGIGGVASVRGLREREATGDRGYFFNIEAHGPQLAGGVKPFVFYDQGGRTHVSPVIGTAQSDNAASIGVGVQWSWKRQLEMSATLATVVNGLAGGTPRGHDKLDFAIFYRF